MHDMNMCLMKGKPEVSNFFVQRLSESGRKQFSTPFSPSAVWRIMSESGDQSRPGERRCCSGGFMYNDRRVTAPVAEGVSIYVRDVFHACPPLCFS